MSVLEQYLLTVLSGPLALGTGQLQSMVAVDEDVLNASLTRLAERGYVDIDNDRWTSTASGTQALS